MLGHSHALSGALTGLAAGALLSLPLGATAALAGFTAGAALLPDLDSCGSSPARSLGFLSGAISHVIRAISGGHRHATHSALGIAFFAFLAWLACDFRRDWEGMAGLALLTALMTAAALEALHLARSHPADAAGLIVAAFVTWHGAGLVMIPAAVALGCATHIAGDMLTRSGCPLGWPASEYRCHLLPARLRFSTGHAVEIWLVGPALIAGIVVLSAAALRVLP